MTIVLLRSKQKVPLFQEVCHKLSGGDKVLNKPSVIAWHTKHALDVFNG